LFYLIVAPGLVEAEKKNYFGFDKNLLIKQTNKKNQSIDLSRPLNNFSFYFLFNAIHIELLGKPDQIL